ncbi:NAD(P)-dependent oxidoreductase [uncultured Azohydromonas sp.]|uniref:NAD(P)-dependent oxidoreductase n=1 Tax=uncultured Azohydromonas sp. TaxID=487342 RepID=UPI0026164287|nr:NAD(P)-dependent oxidoreductase [uncultured Azohydromonas sp.]
MSGNRPRLGFIGLGIMGTPMALRLLDQGWSVTAWNLEPERLAPAVACGARAAADPGEVARASDIVLLCVLDAHAVEACVFGPQGVAAHARHGTLLVDHSTIPPEATRDFATRLVDRAGMHWIDAPVSGGPLQARNGTLTIMAGGESAAIERARPVMSDLAANFTHMGPVGAGQTAKVINQAIVGAGFVLMAEALTLAERAGIAAAELPACLAGGLADSALLQKVYTQMQARDFEPPRGYARQLLKDLDAVLAFSEGLELDLPLVRAAAARYAEYVARGQGLSDTASIVRLYEGK